MSIYQKIIAVQQKLKAPKNQYNSFGKYKYRSCEDILEAVKPILAKQGLFMFISDEVVATGNRFYVKATVTITDGENTISNSAFAREEESKKGMDSSQVTGACSSYARKYALNGMFCIDDTKDSDATNTHEQEPKPTQSEPKPTQQIYDEISEATTLDGLKAIFNKYPNLKSNKNFVAAVTAKKTAIQNGL